MKISSFFMLAKRTNQFNALETLLAGCYRHEGRVERVLDLMDKVVKSAARWAGKGK